MSRQTTQDAINAIIPAEGWEGAPDSTKVVAALNATLGFSAPTTESTTLEILGKGVGATKPTTTIFGTAVIAEVFSVNDEIYFHWPTFGNFDPSVDATVTVHWFATGTEASTTTSWDLSILAVNGNANVLGVTGTEQVVDAAVPGTNGNSAQMTFTVDSATYLSGNTDFHFRLKRVASTSDPIANPAVEHVVVTYGVNA